MNLDLQACWLRWQDVRRRPARLRHVVAGLILGAFVVCVWLWIGWNLAAAFGGVR